jgi:hypothetical protein
LRTRLWNDFILITFNEETKQGGNKKQNESETFFFMKRNFGENITAKHSDGKKQ